MKKIYVAPQNSVVSSRIRCSILAGSNQPSATESFNLGKAQEFDSRNDELGARRRVTSFE